METRKKGNLHNSGPVIDDSWWSSLLNTASKYQGVEKFEEIPYSEKEDMDIDWDLMKKYFRDDEVLSVQVTGYNKGGLLVRGENLKGFIPNSHLKEISQIQSASDRFQSLKKYVGSEMQVKVIECDPVLQKLIFSERAAENAPGRRLDVFEDISIGSVVEGDVTNITKFGVFLDLGGIEGLIHVSEISWGKVNHPSDVVKIGEKVKASVISIDKDKMRIALSMKQLLPNPWIEFNDHYMVRDVITVTINRIVGYGVFADIEDGIEGLVHISDIQSRDSNISLDDLSIGEKIVVTIKAIDIDKRRLSMGFVSKFE